MASDVRYDAILRDLDDAGNVIEELPLILREGDGGGIAFSMSAVSPFAGQLSPGDRQDSDLSRWTVKTQRDWRGGLGQDQAYEPTDAFLKGIADTRFRNSVMLPPMPVQTTVTAPTDPAFQSGGSTVNGVQSVNASWVPRALGSASASSTWALRGTSSQSISASWSTSGRNPTSAQTASSTWSVSLADAWVQDTSVGLAPRTQPTTGQALAVQFTVAQPIRVSQLRLFSSGNVFGNYGVTLSVKANSGGLPSGADLLAGSTTVTGAGTFTVNVNTILPAGTYWHVVTITSGTADINYKTGGATAAYYNGSTWASSTSVFGGIVVADLYTQTGRDLAQVVKVPASFTMTKVRLKLSSVTWGSGQTVTVQIKSYTGANPPAGNIATGTIGSNPGGSAVWVDVPIAASITAGFIWIVLTVSAPTVGANTSLTWHGDANTYAESDVNARTLGGAWGLVATTKLYFACNNGYTDLLPFFYESTLTATQLRQSVTPSANLSVTSIKLYLSRSTWTGTPLVRVRLMNGGTQLGTATAGDPGTTATWVNFPITASIVSGTTYTLILEPNAPTSSDAVTGLAWTGTAEAGFTSYTFNVMALDYQGGGGFNTKGFYMFNATGNMPTAGTPYHFSHTVTRQRLEQNVTPAATVVVTSIKLYLSRSAWMGAPTLTMRVFNGPTQIAVATATDPGATAAWVSFAISTTLTNGVTYKFVVETNAPTITDSVTVLWWGTSEAGATIATYSDATGLWSGATAANVKGCYLVNPTGNMPTLSTPYWFTHTGSEMRRAQSFTTGASGITVNQLRLFLRRLAWTGSPTVTVAIYSNSGGLPNTLLDSATLTAAAFDAASAVTSANWVPITISEVLAATTTYWIVIQPDAPGLADTVSIEWSGDTAAGYAGAFASSMALDGFSYGAFAVTAGFDAYFMVNFGSPLLSAVTVPPLRFKDKWYCASGVTVYRWNTGSSTWESVATAGATVTALSAVAGKIYAALGDNADMIESTTGDNASWAATAGARRYTYLREFGGFMYLAKTDGGANSLAYTNGTLWETALTVGDSLTKITGLAPHANELMILSTRKMFALSSDRVYQTYIYEQEEAADNGRNAAQWIVDGLLYVPVRNGLQAYDGMRMKDVGPDRGEGLPVGQQGRVAAMAGTKTWLFAAIDAGASGTSGLYAYNGREGGGWHCLVRATAPGRRIRAVGLEAITSAAGAARLWFWEEATPYYIELPDLTDNPFQYAGARFASIGELTASKIGGELAQIPKDFQSIGVRADDCTATRTVEVWYEVDSANIWRRAGIVTQSPYQEIALGAGLMANKEIASGSTTTVINIKAPGSTSDIEVGAFVRINNEIRQVSVVNTPTQFTLAIALAAVPADGDTVYASRPAGREIRYRLVLTTADSTKTPRVQRVSIRWQELILQYWRFSMTVKVDDIQTDRRGQSYPYTSAELRRRLKLWIKRLTPFYLDAPDGIRYRVKVMGGNDGNWVRKTNGIDSVMSVNLDEV